MQLKPVTLILLILPCILILCNSRMHSTKAKDTKLRSITQHESFTVVSDIDLPAGFVRITKGDNDFGSWLLEVKIKKDKTVYLYNGNAKPNQEAQFAVLDIPVPNENLQQCADAVMRLRSEFLFEEKKYDQIRFFDNDGKLYRFTAPHTREHFEKFLRRVFGMCGTASLCKQLKTKNLQQIEPGDVFIRGGFPGHAVIVMDVAVNAAGNKIYLLAQSYMPAQNIHILKNPRSPSPWYSLNDEILIHTPEYTFSKSELKGW